MGGIAGQPNQQKSAAPVLGWHDEYKAHSEKPWEATALNSGDEKKFREWISKTEWFDEIKAQVAKENSMDKNEINNNRLVDMITSNSDYDYRGAWKDKVEISRDKHDKGRHHWPSSTKGGKMLKSPKHPTAWKEFFMREHKINPDDIGIKTIEQALEWQKTL